MSDDRPDVPDVPDVDDVPGVRLEGIIGVGASGVVWSGSDATGARVAVKVPRPGVATRAGADAERQVLLGVRHEHLVRLRSVVPLHDGRDALVFDLVEGSSLRAMVDARGHLRPGEVVTILTPLCEAVAALHAAGGLHGDVSPANVRVTPEGRPVLLDLGAARIAGHDDLEVHGTEGFVAPEVRAGAAPTEASDVYALGALAWFCLTGNGAPDTMLRLSPETVVSHVGPELADVVAACLDPDPEVRPSSGALPRLVYDAAPAVPVEVVVAEDLASALTHRIRQQARAQAEASPAGARPWWRHRGVLVGVVTGVGAAAVAVAGVAVAVTRDGGAGPSRPAAVATTAPAGSSPASSAPTPAPSARPATAAPTTVRAATPTPAGAPTPTGEVLTSPTAARDRARDLLQALSDARGTALASRRVDDLAGVYSAGGPAWRLDRDLLATLVRSGARWEGLRLEVARATYVPEPGEGPGRATLRGRVDWTAYTVVTTDGVRASRAAAEGQLLDFHLVRGTGGWRIERISDPPAS